MHIDIYNLRIDSKMENSKRIIVRHYKTFITCLNSPVYNTTLNISAINIIILIRPVSTVYERLSDITLNLYIIGRAVHLIKISRDIPAIDIVYNVLKLHITRCVKLVLVIINKPERYIRMRQCKILHKRINIACLRCRRL